MRFKSKRETLTGFSPRGTCSSTKARPRLSSFAAGRKGCSKRPSAMAPRPCDGSRRGPGTLPRVFRRGNSSKTPPWIIPRSSFLWGGPLARTALPGRPPPRLFSAIGVHRHLIINDTLIRDNPFYIPAEKFIPLSPEERERDLVNLFREAGFDVNKFLDAIVGFGRLQRSPTAEP